MKKDPVFRFLEVLTRSLLLAFWDYRTEGEDHVPAEGGVILACTHQSHLDPVMITAPLHRRVGYVARSTLFGNRWFAKVISYLGAMAFDRESGSAGELKGVMDALDGGKALIFFPEGTRTPDGELQKLKPGIALLARRAAVPVVPVAIEGTFRCWPRQRKLFRPGRVRIVYGEPVTYDKRAKKNEVLSDLGARLSALRERALNMC